MTIFKTLSIFVLFSVIVGCSSYSTGQFKNTYTPISIGVSNPKRAATIKAADGLTIWEVDGRRKVSVAKAMNGQGLDSVILPSGEHYITGAIRGQNVSIDSLYYKPEHEYFIGYVMKAGGSDLTIQYWVKDLTENEVVLGKEISEEDLGK